MNRYAICGMTLLWLALMSGLSVQSAFGAEECSIEPKTACFGIESVSASLSTTQAGAHPDLSLNVDIKQDPESDPNVFGLGDGYATTRNLRFNIPPGLIGDPNVMGVPQQCTAQELVELLVCPNGSQVGVTTISAYQLNSKYREPIYMMQPPGGDVVARLGTVAGLYPTFIDVRVRSESDYGLVAEVRDAPTVVRLIGLETTLWGVPSHSTHDKERCIPSEVFTENCLSSPERDPGSRPLPFLTNPTRCGVPMRIGVNASSWIDSKFDDAKEVKASLPEITGCDRLPFGPGLVIEPTNHRAAAPTGLDVTVRLPAAPVADSEDVAVLEPAQARHIKVNLARGLTINPGSGDGLSTCSAEEVRLGQRIAAGCPDAAKLAEFEAEISALPRRLKGAIYLRDPEPGNNFRFWVVADDLGAHVKLQGQLNVDQATGEIESVLLDLPQVPLREAKIVFKSGFRAPLANPPVCGNYVSSYEFTPWSGGPEIGAQSPISIDEGCAVGAFNPGLEAGSVSPAAGQHSPFVFTLSREDGEQNPQDLDIVLPRGLVATFAGIPRCLGTAAETGACAPESRIGKVVAALGTGPAPLWVPQPGKRPTAVYLSGPYKGQPLSIVAVVPRQAGPFDFGDEVVRSAIAVDPTTAQATAFTDPLPQLIEGIPITYRKIHVELDRPDFAENPTSCARKETVAVVTSSAGAVARPSSPFTAVNCAAMHFRPRLSFKLRGGTRRGAFPSLRAVVRPRPGDANIARASVALPRSIFLEQGHIKTVCTRVQFAADGCPIGSIYGHAVARSPLFDEKLTGYVYLRSSSNPLPDLVVALKGPDTLPVEVNLAGRIDSINGGIRSTFDLVPDAPVTSFVLTMQGGSKGLLVNSTNLCARAQRATAKLTAQNGRKQTLYPVVRSSCMKQHKRSR